MKIKGDGQKVEFLFFYAGCSPVFEKYLPRFLMEKSSSLMIFLYPFGD
jgi:hypothetical protein